MLWKISLPHQHPISEVCKFVFFKTCQSLCGGNPDSLPGKKNDGILHIIPWESISCEDKYTIIQVWKKKKVPPQYIPQFMSAGDVLGLGTVWEKHHPVWKRHYLKQQKFLERRAELAFSCTDLYQTVSKQIVKSRVYKVKQLPTFYMAVKTREVC